MTLERGDIVITLPQQPAWIKKWPSYVNIMREYAGKVGEVRGIIERNGVVDAYFVKFSDGNSFYYREEWVEIFKPPLLEPELFEI